MATLKQMRKRMAAEQARARGISDNLVLAALEKVPREAFVPRHLRQLAYDDSALPIGFGQTISQPYIVALMIEALALNREDKVLEIGAGSGYAAALLAEIASEVYAIERIGPLARAAAKALKDTGYANVEVRHADGTEGWPEHAPYDAILVSAGAPGVPEKLKRQLALGGRMVIPVGVSQLSQTLVKITRTGEETFEEEDLADVRFVPLIGASGWEEQDLAAEDARPRVIFSRSKEPQSVPALLSIHAQSFAKLEDADLDPLVRRASDALIVLLGEATHGTSEFYRMRGRITRALIEQQGFNLVALEADWPDAAMIDHYVRHREPWGSGWRAFARFPVWMWRNEEFKGFVEWLRSYNRERPFAERVAICGLDLYSMYTSIAAVIAYLDQVDPDLARIARERYACLSPWEADPVAYGRAAVSRAYRDCEDEVVRVLLDLLQKQEELMARDGERFFDAVQNARLVGDAERYYRVMYSGSRAAWNLRDSHMFDTLLLAMEWRGTEAKAKAIIWAHNSHVGDALATEMSARGEHNLGKLCRGAFGHSAHLVGFGTDHGTVAAAAEWDAPMEIMDVTPAHPQSYEHLCHLTNKEGFILPLGHHVSKRLRQELLKPRLERAIGVIYRPHSELASHYFEAVLPDQFDDYIWFDETHAIKPLKAHEVIGELDTYPFGV